MPTTFVVAVQGGFGCLLLVSILAALWIMIVAAAVFLL